MELMFGPVQGVLLTDGSTALQAIIKPPKGMFDWLSISTNDPDTWERITNVSFLEFEDTIRHGELLFGKAADMGVNSKLQYRKNMVRLGFSPHKLYNGLHGVVNPNGMPMNHDTFTPQALSWVFEWLHREFALNPANCQLHHVEFGVNLWGLPVPTEKILNSLIAYAYKGKQIKDMEVSGIGDGRVVKFSQYELKFYDKSLQNLLPYSILRIEYKARKMQPVQKIFGEYPVLSDLLNPILWVKCRNRLRSVIEYCIFDDEFPFEQDRNLVTWRNPREWSAMNSTKRSRNQRKLDNLVQKKGKLKIKEKLLLAVEKECDKMLIEHDGAMILPIN